MPAPSAWPRPRHRLWCCSRSWVQRLMVSSTVPMPSPPCAGHVILAPIVDKQLAWGTNAALGMIEADESWPGHAYFQTELPLPNVSWLNSMLPRLLLRTPRGIAMFSPNTKKPANGPASGGSSPTAAGLLAHFSPSGRSLRERSHSMHR